jgi:hypothetical protein
MSARNALRRVKVYQLSGSDGLWVDSGTGYVQLVYSDVTQETYFLVKSDTNENEVLLECKIYADDIYQRQQGE